VEQHVRAAELGARPHTWWEEAAAQLPTARQ
jgi:hypothetical protein